MSTKGRLYEKGVVEKKGHSCIKPSNFQDKLTDMDNDDSEISYRLAITKEHLVSLCVSSKVPNDNDKKDFIKLLSSKDFDLKNLSSLGFSHICYFVMGLINLQDRNKLLQWPLLTKTDQTKFRKGICTMVNNLKEKYPWAVIKKLPESYFLQPQGSKKKVLDFIIGITTLAIHLLLGDPSILIMNDKKELNRKQVELMTNEITKACIHQENIIENNFFPVENFEKVRNGITRNCLNLKKENDELKNELLTIKKQLIKRGIVMKENIEAKSLKKLHDEKTLELKNSNKELNEYNEPCVKMSSMMKAANEPISLSASDFNLNASNDLSDSTNEACDNLDRLLHHFSFNQTSRAETKNLSAALKRLKKTLIEEKEACVELLQKFSEDRESKSFDFDLR